VELEEDGHSPLIHLLGIVQLILGQERWKGWMDDDDDDDDDG